MNLLYLSYWGLADGLTQSSVLPHLEILARMARTNRIIFVTVERDAFSWPELTIDKVEHVPLTSKTLGIGLLTKVFDFISFPRLLSELVTKYEVDQVLCRTALGGALGYLLYKKDGTPFSVESFEPHADYMLEAGVWSRFGFKYQFQKYWELKVVHHAKSLVTVSNHYRLLLQKRYHREVHNFGCAVDLTKFRFDLRSRQQVRKAGQWQDCIVGIYVGKFGDIYYQEKAFAIFKQAFDHFGRDFRLVILTPQDRISILENLEKSDIPSSSCLVTKVLHSEVATYLSASDFAFSMVRPAPIRLYCSPIKDGEYWANGLPVLSAHGIGEDSEIIAEEGAGALFDDDLGNLNDAFRKIESLIEVDQRHGDIRSIAEKHRNFENLSDLYEQILR